MDAGELFHRAVEHKVAFVTEHPFFFNGGGHNTLGLSYAKANYENMEVAIRVLGKLIKDSLSRSNKKETA